MSSNDDVTPTGLGCDPRDPGSVAARRRLLLARETGLMAAAAVVAAAQVRVRAELAEIAAALDAAEGSVEHRLHVRSLAAEVALVEQVGQSVAEGLLQEAVTAVREFPGLVDALGAGAVSEAQLRVLTEAGLSVSHVNAGEQTARRAAFVRVMLAEVGARVLPPRALRGTAARVAESLTQESVCERFARARKTRYVSVTEAENGMCLLRARLPLIEGKAIADRLRKQAKAVIRARPAPAGITGRAGSPGAAGSAGDTQSTENTQSTGGIGISESAASGARAEGADATRDEGPGVMPGEMTDEAPDERTVDQVKADLFADVLLTSTPTSNGAAAGIEASVQFTIPILTLLGPDRAVAPDTDRLTPAPALLNGMSPIPLEEAKRLAANAPSFQRILTHPITGAVAAVDTYRPTAAMRAFLTARDIHCRWPGCRQPAACCDLDHTHAWEHGGTTSIDNLCGLCRGHHVMKHATAWTVRQLGGGVLEWRTPSGKTYTDQPEHHDTHANTNIEFRPSDEARDGRAATGMAMPRPTSQQNSNVEAPAPDEPEQRESADELPPF
ncbi:HNH endonuclease signature motif containing protein [Pseudoclavibacter sp. VKM Ac-2888]|uniref:HNH endonuclease signature motif containing protein n=1 Tax=Pseudoclavibacter sp. VKM Ac-2888 TaxID=2783830 RepID=UPI00188CFF31|nr:HNH endonuclease signature motif containing protein [Pseudoclavibacter sp. VKM Ac-2888]MBF4548884.1 DUF222 domain-containing protein [Pseudoclavibacter sp. VKM Ac-2888]